MSIPMHPPQQAPAIRSTKTPPKNIALMAYLKRDPFPAILAVSQELLVVKNAARHALAEGSMVNSHLIQEMDRLENKLKHYWQHPIARKTIVGGYEDKAEMEDLLGRKRNVEENIAAFARAMRNDATRKELTKQWQALYEERKRARMQGK